jgi:diguanylate cyclase (GGDEF)-like protein/PAS domain S-box-containing protein
MNRGPSPPSGDASEEILALIKTLHQAGLRLEELTSSEVDTVNVQDGQPLMLPRSQEHFRHSEAAKRAAVLDALPANIAVLDVQGVILGVNEGWRRFGRANGLHSPEHCVGVSYLAICDQAVGADAAQARRAAEGIRSVLDGGEQQVSFEYPCHSPEEQRWFQMMVTPLAKDRLSGVVVMHLDVTARTLAEAGQRESELKFRQMSENIQDAFFLADADGRRVLYVSHAFETIWGRPREELYANSELWLDQIHPEDRSAAMEAYAQGLKVGHAAFEYRVVRPDGSIRWVELRAFPVRDDTGKVIRIAGVTKDITAHKRNEGKFQALLEATPDALVVCNGDGDMVLVNSQAVRLFGRTREEMLGHKIESLIPEHHLGRPPGRGAGSLAHPRTPGMGAGMEMHGLRRDGTEFPVEISLSPLETDEGSVVMSAIRDITVRKQAEAELARTAQGLRESERRFTDFLANVRLLSMMLDTEGRITYCNECLLRLTGWKREEVIGRNWSDLFVPPELTEVSGPLFASLLADLPESWHHENEILTRSGERRLIRFSNSVLRSGDGQVVGTASIGEDVTDQKVAQDRVALLNRVYAVLSGIGTLIVRAKDREELFEEACRVAVEAGGFRMALISMLDRTTMRVVPVASAGKGDRLLAATRNILASDETAPRTMTMRAMTGKKALVANDSRHDPQVLIPDEYAEAGVSSMAVFPLIVDDEAVGVLALYATEVGFFHEGELKLLTELAGDIAFAIGHLARQARLNYLAYYDVLTGLANRTLFLERVAQHLRSAASNGHKLALFLMDLERFKNLNDSLGRPAGDELLRQVAAWLTRLAVDASLVARVGADVFAVVLEEVREDGNLAVLIDDALAAFLDHPFHLKDSVFRIAARGGVSSFPEDGADAEMLFRNAEAALKKAKARGERYLFYAQTMNAAGASRLTLETQLRQALEKEEFVLHYQPKVSLSSGEVTSAEGLIRWNDPRTGLVPPGKFIPILEETGMITNVGRWAMRKAIEDYLRWGNAGLPAVRLAVNVSPLQLRHRGFIGEIREAIGRDPRAPAGLELEITESLIMEDVKHSIASLKAIRDLGITVAIDDFGTGFSSLSYLSRLPVDTLKIDRSFVMGMTESPEGLSLVSTIINLAHSLKLKVVAEGVETEERASLLRLLGCEEMQGFLFSKPVPVEIFETTFLAPAPTP